MRFRFRFDEACANDAPRRLPAAYQMAAKAKAKANGWRPTEAHSWRPTEAHSWRSPEAHGRRHGETLGWRHGETLGWRPATNRATPRAS